MNLGFFLQRADGELGFTDHKDATGDETEDGGSTRQDGDRGGNLKQRSLVVVGGNGSADGNQRGSREEPKPGIEGS